MKPALQFKDGHIHFDHLPDFIDQKQWSYSKFTQTYSADAIHYRSCIEKAVEYKSLDLIHDSTPGYKRLKLQFKKQITPRHHQKLALEAWQENKMRGVVSLPTGAGKTILAVLAIHHANRSALIVVPTIDLIAQWKKTLKDFFGISIGQLGGGEFDIQDITVATYDSAHMHSHRIGNLFGLLVVDECHHLPAPQNRQIALQLIAPFRLGLSATVERSDGLEELIYEYLGPMVYRAEIQAMQNNVLSPYDIHKIEIDLTDQEIEDYKRHRQIYTSFLRSKNINMSQPGGWMDFIKKSSYLPGGKQAMESYRKQKNIALGASGKIHAVWEILKKHPHEQVIVFTQDNQMAYKIGQIFCLAVLTHKTKSSERKTFLSEFRSGKINVLVTSKVLNEGVDVPEASVGIVVSGSSVVREHVQRLGRILRHQEGKVASLYEIVSKNTIEQRVNERRRQHGAYQTKSFV